MFWIISAILIIIALAFIVPALLKRDNLQDATREQNISIAQEQLSDLELRFSKGDIDQEGYQATKQELELALYSDLQESDSQIVTSSNNQAPSLIGILPILLLIPLIAVPVYLQLGNLNFTKQLDPKMAARDVAKASMPLKPDGSPDIGKITQNLRTEVEGNPTDPQGWYMLGRAYMLLKDYPQAADSFDKSLSLRPNTAETMLSLADALSMSNNGQLVGRPRDLVSKALQLEPQNLTGLWLSGMAASQAAEYPEAITQWQKVLPLLEQKPNEKTAVLNLIEEAKSRLNPDQQKQLTTAESQTQENNTNANDAEIKVTVSLSSALADQASPEDSVFIYAKAVNGPPMPLAAVRKKVKDLPLEVTLNDAMAMMPNLKLSSFQEVAVGARISKAGQAIPKDGDLFTEKTDVKSTDSIALEIDQIYKK